MLTLLQQQLISIKQPLNFFRVHFYKNPTLALIYFHCCLTNPRSAIFNDEMGLTKDNTAMWNCISKLIGSPIGQHETVLCQQTFQDLDRSHARISACASCCERLVSPDNKAGLVQLNINDLPPAFLLTDLQD